MRCGALVCNVCGGGGGAGKAGQEPLRRVHGSGPFLFREPPRGGAPPRAPAPARWFFCCWAELVGLASPFRFSCRERRTQNAIEQIANGKWQVQVPRESSPAGAGERRAQIPGPVCFALLHRAFISSFPVLSPEFPTQPEMHLCTCGYLLCAWSLSWRRGCQNPVG